MEVKEIFLILSKGSEDITYSSLIFETRAEKIAILCSLGFFILYIALIAFGYVGVALLFAVLTIIALFSYSIASFISSKNFLINPVKFYVEGIHEQIDAEKVLTGQLSIYSTESLSEAKNISERRNIRIKKQYFIYVGCR